MVIRRKKNDILRHNPLKKGGKFANKQRLTLSLQQQFHLRNHPNKEAPHLTATFRH